MFSEPSRVSTAKSLSPTEARREEKSSSASEVWARNSTLLPVWASVVATATATWVAPVPGGVSTTTECPETAASTTAC